MGRNRMGFAKKEVEQMYFGEWQSYFETYKMVYNFEISRQMFKDNEVNESEPESGEPLGSISDL